MSRRECNNCEWTGDSSGCVYTNHVSVSLLCPECFGGTFEPSPRISPELARKIAAESYKFVDSNSDMYTDMTDSEMIDAIASIIERVGNED